MNRIVWLTLVCTVGVGLFACTSCGRKTKDVVWNTNPEFDKAIVFDVKGKRSNVIGVSSNKSFIASTIVLPATKRFSDGMYVTVIGRKGPKTVFVGDHPDLLKLAMVSRLPHVAKPKGPWECKSFSETSRSALYLDSMTGTPDIIVFGTAIGIEAEEHIPPSSSKARQHTLYSFAIDKVLKTRGFPMLPNSVSYVDGAPQIPTDFEKLPPVIGISVAMGGLPWQEGNAKGVGYRLEGEIPLAIGGRYLLFLSHFSHAACPECGADPPDTRGLDVYAAAFPSRGVIAIANGLTAVPDFCEEGEWKLRTDSGKIDPNEQLFGLNEDQVTARLNNSMAKVRARVEADHRKLDAIELEYDRTHPK